jgi:hypothetical protein
MTSVGLFLFFVGWLIGELYGSPRFIRVNKADYVAGILILVGSLLTIIGLCAYLWKTMP